MPRTAEVEEGEDLKKGRQIEGFYHRRSLSWRIEKRVNPEPSRRRQDYHFPTGSNTACISMHHIFLGIPKTNAIVGCSLALARLPFSDQQQYGKLEPECVKYPFALPKQKNATIGCYLPLARLPLQGWYFPTRINA